MSITGRIISHLFATARNRDGQAPGLEREISGGGVMEKIAAIDSMVQAGNLLPAGAAPRPTVEDGLHAILARKVLHGWGQNRNQTLHPLTLNFSSMPAADASVVMEAVACALLATGQDDADRVARADGALRMVHASPAQLDALHRALGEPPALHLVLRRLHRSRMGGHAYAATLRALDLRDGGAASFARYMAGRLGLPEDVASSLERRYRG
ncbi:hypothetical protein [Rhizosaccharibacter radicis]|uniref:Uncharacterized protein n=1 Tax=Rhizosaccharibacter radicis TaxID=2782605 RepID=A0ABT1VTT1_9PROT|nr:hypothetical protein [Acetobacteraceae bacterium KSS12]